MHRSFNFSSMHPELEQNLLHSLLNHYALCFDSSIKWKVNHKFSSLFGKMSMYHHLTLRGDNLVHLKGILIIAKYNVTLKQGENSFTTNKFILDRLKSKKK